MALRLVRYLAVFFILSISGLVFSQDDVTLNPVFPGDGTASPITLENAADVTQVAQVGRGRVFALDWWDADQNNEVDSVIAASSVGVWRYSLDGSLTSQPFIPAQTAVNRAAFHWQTGQIAVAEVLSRQINLYDADGKPGRTMTLGLGAVFSDITALTFSLDGSQLFGGLSTGELMEWDTASGRLINLVNLVDDAWFGRVEDITFSPHGTLIAATTGENRVLILDFETLSVDFVLEPSEGDNLIAEVSFVPNPAADTTANYTDATEVAITYVDKLVRWKFLEDQTEILSVPKSPDLGGDNDEFGSRSTINDQVSISADGTKIAVATTSFTEFKGYVVVYTVENSELSAILHENYHGYLLQALFHPTDPNRLVLSGYGGQIDVWKLESNSYQRLADGHFAASDVMALSPDESQLVMSGYDHSIHVIDTTTGKEIANLLGSWDDVTAAAFNGDGTTLAASSRWRTLAWDTASLNSQPTIVSDFGQGAMLDIVFEAPIEGDTMDGTTLHMAQKAEPVSGTLDEPGYVSFWDVNISEFGLVDADFINTSFQPRLFTFSPDGRHAALIELLPASSDSAAATRIAVIESTSRELLAEYPLHSVVTLDPATLAYSADSRYIVFTSGSTISILDVETFMSDVGADNLLLNQFDAGEHWATAAAFSPDKTLLATGSNDRTVRLWDWTTGSLLATLAGHTDAVKSLIFTADANYLLSGSYDGTTRVWGVTR